MEFNILSVKPTLFSEISNMFNIFLAEAQSTQRSHCVS